MPRVWNPSNRNYYDGSSRIPRSDVRGWVNASSAETRDKLRAIGNEFLSGKINSAQAEIDATELVTNHHSAIAVIANGGRDQMDASSWGRSGQVIKEQRAFMGDLWRGYENGDVSDAGLLNRLGLYGDTGGLSYERMFTAYAVAAGFDQVFNIQGDTAAPCNECLELTAAGPMSADEMPDPGDRECSIGCDCTVGVVGIDDVED